MVTTNNSSQDNIKIRDLRTLKIYMKITRIKEVGSRGGNLPEGETMIYPHLICHNKDMVITMEAQETILHLKKKNDNTILKEVEDPRATTMDSKTEITKDHPNRT